VIFEAFTTNALDLQRFSSKSIYILIGLEETNTAVYICSLKPYKTFRNGISGPNGPEWESEVRSGKC
jgi:hypothetical protein